jgi:peptidoglycan/xylan/chitin deacetylase (PgdA/CDA1 family)
VDESLGLPVGILDKEDLPDNLVETIVSAVRGYEPQEHSYPIVETKLKKFLKGVELKMLKAYGFSVFKERWPKGSEYAVALTHDVDNIERPLSHIFKIRERFRKHELLLHLIGLRSLYNNIKYTANIEKKRNLRSTFFLLTSNYSLDKIARDVKELTSLGWEIGLHGGNNTHQDEKKMGEEIEKFSLSLGFKPEGIREHYLRFDYTKTWQIMEKYLITYDSTVGNTDKLGFRIGICTPFHPPDSNWKNMNLLEIPLVIMDTTLWGYLKKGEQEGLEEIVKIKDIVKSVNGLFTILWHTESLRMRGGRLYPKILDTLMLDEPYISNAINIARWWEMRRKATLTIEREKIRLEGGGIGLALRFRALKKRVIEVKGGYLEHYDDFDRIISTSETVEVRLE